MEQAVQQAGRTYDLGSVAPIKLQVRITKTDALYLKKIMRIEEERGGVYDGIGIPPFDSQVEGNDALSTLPVFGEGRTARKENLKNAMCRLWRKGLLKANWRKTKNGYNIPYYGVPEDVGRRVLMGEPDAVVFLNRRKVAVLMRVLECYDSPAAQLTALTKVSKEEGRLVEKKYPVVSSEDISSKTGIPPNQVGASICELGSRGFVIPVKQFSTLSTAGLDSAQVFWRLFPPGEKPSALFPASEAGFQFLPKDIEREIGAWALRQINENLHEWPRRDWETPRRLLSYKELMQELKWERAGNAHSSFIGTDDIAYELTPLAALQIGVIDTLWALETPVRTVKEASKAIARLEPREIGAALTPLRLKRLRRIFESRLEDATPAGPLVAD
jgi:hypothetical protein